MPRKQRLSAQEIRYLECDERYDSLPDGAYFAAMEEEGFDAATIIELSESIAEKQGAKEE